MFRTMNHIHIAGLALTLALTGCSRQQAPKPQADAAPKADPNAVALGQPNTAGPFTVTLSTKASTVKVGNVAFAADVVKDGTPVKDGTVRIALSMPQMNMPGPSAPLTWSGKAYTGDVEAGMAGEWQADVTVVGSGDSGHAAWVFHVME